MGGQWYEPKQYFRCRVCDKNMPGCIIAMGRLNRPSIMVYGGTIRAGHSTVDQPGKAARYCERVPEATASSSAAISAEDVRKVMLCGMRARVRVRAVECTRRIRWHVQLRRLGMSAAACSASTPAEDPQKLDECVAYGQSNAAFAGDRSEASRHHDARCVPENAMVITSVLGGSTQRGAAFDCDGAVGGS